MTQTPLPAEVEPATEPAAEHSSETAAEAASARRSARPLGLVLAVAFAVLLVLAGVDPWWMIPLAAAAAPLGLADRGARLGVLAMALAAGAGAVAVLAGWADLRDALVTAARGVVTGVLPWSVAMAWQARRSAEADAAMMLVREQDARRLRAETDLARQRLHLAEGLHDDLGHALSLVALNLGRLELELERGLGDDTGRAAGTASGRVTERDREAERRRAAADSARASVGLARRQVSDAVARLGASVQTLRTGLPDDTRATTIGADLDVLVRDARRAGADVELDRSLAPARLVPFGPAVARVVQEGLTNALKHAPGLPVRIRLEPGDGGLGSEDRPGGEAEDTGSLVVTVRNPLSATSAASAADSASGTGIRALAEHVRAAGGSVEAGPASSEYVLRAELRPVARPPSPVVGVPPARPVDLETPGRPADPTPRGAQAVTVELARARRRGGALLVAAVLVPTAALVAVAAAIQLADHVTARNALLDPAAFARVAVGDPRSAVEPVLPGATLRPPPGADPSCDHYAVTADPLADASGDAYRICWSDDRVASAELVTGGAS
ncbi:sensor histidine kinase [Promicromonospora sukumoe]|uniref:sensor histidine kinase n=1 Tax=Promicromonospora sukumoe TaxID=88382 RepID=UPI0003635E44|nr:ATP-binding protein [Promicromonospora sukumoe]